MSGSCLGCRTSKNRVLGIEWTDVATARAVSGCFWTNLILFCRTIQDPRSQRLTWYKPPLSVLVIKKIFDADVIEPYLELVTWLVEVSLSSP